MEGTGQSQEDLVRTLITPLYQAKGWLKLVGVMSIIGGVLTVLSIWGIIIAWLPIWLGVLLFQAAGAAEMAYTNGSEQSMLLSLSKLKTYFVITGVMTIIGMIFAILGIIAAIMIPTLLMMENF